MCQIVNIKQNGISLLTVPVAMRTSLAILIEASDSVHPLVSIRCPDFPVSKFLNNLLSLTMVNTGDYVNYSDHSHGLYNKLIYILIADEFGF